MITLSFARVLSGCALLYSGLVLHVSPAHAQSGLPLWTNRADVPSGGMAIAVDKNGNAFVTGGAPDANGVSDFGTVAYSGAGVPLWTNWFNGPGDGGDSPQAIAVDSNGNVFLTGEVHGINGDWDFGTICYSNTGEFLWSNYYDGPGNALDRARAIAVDSKGNVYVAGWSYAGADFTTEDYATVAYSGAGVPLWTNRYDGPGNDIDEVMGIAADDAGHVFVTGSSFNANRDLDYATVAYSDAGVPLWTNRFARADGVHDSAFAIAVDRRGKVFVTGFSGSDFATVAYSVEGIPLWTNYFTGRANTGDARVAITTDNNGNVFIAGASAGPGGRPDYATVAYSGEGAALWTNRYDTPGHSEDVPLAITADASGNVFVTGYSLRNTSYTSSDYATVAYSGSGVPLWTNRFNAPQNDQDIANAIKVDGSGNVFVTGGVTGIGAVTIKYASSVQAYLGIQTIDNAVVLTWTNNGFRLQSAPTIATTFTNIPGAISPYTNPANGSQQFFRLIGQ